MVARQPNRMRQAVNFMLAKVSLRNNFLKMFFIPTLNFVNTCVWVRTRY